MNWRSRLKHTGSFNRFWFPPCKTANTKSSPENAAGAPRSARASKKCLSRSTKERKPKNSRSH